MKLFHTSPTPITKISTTGRFGEFLFFSSQIYVMTASSDYVTYEIDLEEDDVINAGQFFYHEDSAKLDGLVAEFCRRFDVDADTAEEIISEREQLDSDDSDDLWDVQHFTARAGKLLGYRAVRMTDEQGGAYLVDMMGKESEMVAA